MFKNMIKPQNIWLNQFGVTWIQKFVLDRELVRDPCGVYEFKFICTAEKKKNREENKARQRSIQVNAFHAAKFVAQRRLNCRSTVQTCSRITPNLPLYPPTGATIGCAPSITPLWIFESCRCRRDTWTGARAHVYLTPPNVALALALALFLH